MVALIGGRHRRRVVGAVGILAAQILVRAIEKIETVIAHQPPL